METFYSKYSFPLRYVLSFLEEACFNEVELLHNSSSIRSTVDRLDQCKLKTNALEVF